MATSSTSRQPMFCRKMRASRHGELTSAPTATVPRCAGARPRRRSAEQRHLRPEPVLRLVEHHRPRAVEDAVGDLLATVRRQAVHDPRGRRSEGEERVIDLEVAEVLAAALLFGLLAHAGPHVRVHDVRRRAVPAPDRDRQGTRCRCRAASRRGRAPPRRARSPAATRCAGRRPLIAAAYSHDVHTLLPSPMYATRAPAIVPVVSSTVIRSARSWHGCSVSVIAADHRAAHRAAMATRSRCEVSRAMTPSA